MIEFVRHFQDGNGQQKNVAISVGRCVRVIGYPQVRCPVLGSRKPTYFIGGVFNHADLKVSSDSVPFFQFCFFNYRSILGGHLSTVA